MRVIGAVPQQYRALSVRPCTYISAHYLLSKTSIADQLFLYICNSGKLIVRLIIRWPKFLPCFTIFTVILYKHTYHGVGFHRTWR